MCRHLCTNLFTCSADQPGLVPGAPTNAIKGRTEGEDTLSCPVLSFCRTLPCLLNQASDSAEADLTALLLRVSPRRAAGSCGYSYLTFSMGAQRWAAKERASERTVLK